MLLYYAQDGGRGGTLRLEHLDWGGPNGEPPDSRSFITWMEAGHLWPWTLRWNDSLYLCEAPTMCLAGCLLQGKQAPVPRLGRDPLTQYIEVPLSPASRCQMEVPVQAWVSVPAVQGTQRGEWGRVTPPSRPASERETSPPDTGTVTASCDMEGPRTGTKGPPFSPLIKLAHRWLLKSPEETVCSMTRYTEQSR